MRTHLFATGSQGLQESRLLSFAPLNAPAAGPALPGGPGATPDAAPEMTEAEVSRRAKEEVNRATTEITQLTQKISDIDSKIAKLRGADPTELQTEKQRLEQQRSAAFTTQAEAMGKLSGVDRAEAEMNQAIAEGSLPKMFAALINMLNALGIKTSITPEGAPANGPSGAPNSAPNAASEATGGAPEADKKRAKELADAAGDIDTAHTNAKTAKDNADTLLSAAKGNKAIAEGAVTAAKSDVVAKEQNLGLKNADPTATAAEKATAQADLNTAKAQVITAEAALKTQELAVQSAQEAYDKAAADFALMDRAKDFQDKTPALENAKMQTIIDALKPSVDAGKPGAAEFMKLLKSIVPFTAGTEPFTLQMKAGAKIDKLYTELEKAGADRTQLGVDQATKLVENAAPLRAAVEKVSQTVAAKEAASGLEGLTGTDATYGQEILDGKYGNINKITKLNEVLAKKIAENGDASTDLSALTSLDVGVAKILAQKNDANISLNGLSAISKEAFHELMNGSISMLDLNGLPGLTSDLLTEMKSTTKTPTLEFSGIGALDPAQLPDLAACKMRIYFLKIDLPAAGSPIHTALAAPAGKGKYVFKGYKDLV